MTGKFTLGFLCIVGAVILIILAPNFQTSITEFRSDEYTDVYTNETTDEGVTSVNVTLVNDLFLNDHQFAIATSNITSDSPHAAGYNSVDGTLEINGLAESETRTLVVTYNSPSLTGYQGVDTLAENTPLIMWAAIIMLPMLIIIYMVYIVAKGR